MHGIERAGGSCSHFCSHHAAAVTGCARVERTQQQPRLPTRLTPPPPGPTTFRQRQRFIGTNPGIIVTRESLQVGGRRRTLTVVHRKESSTKPVPVVLVFHGSKQMG